MGNLEAWRRSALIIEAQAPVARLSVVDPSTGLLDRGFAFIGVDEGALSSSVDALLERAAAPPARSLVVHDGALSGAMGAALDALQGRLDGPSGGIPQRLDARLCAVWGEASHGSGADGGDQLHVGLGSAISGIVLNGSPYLGADGHGGRTGCWQVDPRGPPCECGGRGCLAAYTSLAGLRRAGMALGLAGARPARPGHDPGMLADLVERASGGCPLAGRVLARAGRALGIAVGGLLNTLDVVDVIVHCPVAAVWPLVRPAAMSALQRHSFAAVRADVRWRLAELGSEAVPLGAVGWPVRV